MLRLIRTRKQQNLLIRRLELPVMWTESQNLPDGNPPCKTFCVDFCSASLGIIQFPFNEISGCVLSSLAAASRLPGFLLQKLHFFAQNRLGPKSPQNR
jgi:hypothetical protein